MVSTSSSDPGLKAEVGGGGENSEPMIANDQLLLYRGLKKAKKERGCTTKERISKVPPCTAGKRSSIYRGVTRRIDPQTCPRGKQVLPTLLHKLTRLEAELAAFGGRERI